MPHHLNALGLKCLEHHDQLLQVEGDVLNSEELIQAGSLLSKDVVQLNELACGWFEQCVQLGKKKHIVFTVVAGFVGKEGQHVRPQKLTGMLSHAPCLALFEVS